MAKGMYIGNVKPAQTTGMTLTNLVTNGDFSNGLNEWTLSHTEYLSASSDKIDNKSCIRVEVIAPYTSDTSYVGLTPVSQSLSLDDTHIYYVCGYFRGSSSNRVISNASASVRLSGTFGTLNGSNYATTEWILASARVDSITAYKKVSLIVSNNASGDVVGNVYYFTDIKVFDLTAAFGAGSEPAKDWCDQNLVASSSDVDNIAYKMTKGYIGVDTIARKEDNLVANGDFSNGTTGWRTNSEGSLSASSGICTFTYLADRGAAAVPMETNLLATIPQGHLIYCALACTCNLTNYDSSSTASVKIRLSGQSSSDYQNILTFSAEASEWKTFYGTLSFDAVIFEISASLAAYGGTVKTWGIKVFDLTEIFGAGSEPDKTWCDQYLQTATQLGEKARKIKKGYIGVDNVARLFFSAT